jgi:hypothetical protein
MPVSGDVPLDGKSYVRKRQSWKPQEFFSEEVAGEIRALITAEASAREGADTALQGNIDAETTAREAEEPRVQPGTQFRAREGSRR